MGAVMRDRELTHAEVALEARLQQIISMPAGTCNVCNIQELYNSSTPGVQVGRETMMELQHDSRGETMWWPEQVQGPADEGTTLEDDTAANRAADLCARQKESITATGTCTWWTAELQTDNGGVRVAVLFLISDNSTIFRYYLGMG
jgi:hypothetical protein